MLVYISHVELSKSKIKFILPRKSVVFIQSLVFNAIRNVWSRYDVFGEI